MIFWRKPFSIDLFRNQKSKCKGGLLDENNNSDGYIQYGEAGCLGISYGEKDADLQAELNDTVQKLYEKYVPQATREYIDDKVVRDAAKERPRRPARPVPRNMESGREENQ